MNFVITRTARICVVKSANANRGFRPGVGLTGKFLQIFLVKNLLGN